MSENFSVQVSNNHTKAKVDMAIVDMVDHVEKHALLSAKQARRIAIKLLQAAQDAEEQFAQNVQRVQALKSSDAVSDDDARRVAEDFGLDWDRDIR